MPCKNVQEQYCFKKIAGVVWKNVAISVAET